MLTRTDHVDQDEATTHRLAQSWARFVKIHKLEFKYVESKFIMVKQDESGYLSFQLPSSRYYEPQSVIVGVARVVKADFAVNGKKLIGEKVLLLEIADADHVSSEYADSTEGSFLAYFSGARFYTFEGSPKVLDVKTGEEVGMLY